MKLWFVNCLILLPTCFLHGAGVAALSTGVKLARAYDPTAVPSLKFESYAGYYVQWPVCLNGTKHLYGVDFMENGVVTIKPHVQGLPDKVLALTFMNLTWSYNGKTFFTATYRSLYPTSTLLPRDGRVTPLVASNVFPNDGILPKSSSEIKTIDLISSEIHISIWPVNNSFTGNKTPVNFVINQTQKGVPINWVSDNYYGDGTNQYPPKCPVPGIVT